MTDYRIIQGDALTVLKTLESESVQCVVTSPPYFGLRDYGTATWEGGDVQHEHDRVAARNGRGGSGSGDKQPKDTYPSTLPAAACSCGAIRIDAQIGMETTPQLFVAKMVEVFNEVRRVLKKDGTLWLNLGDSYAGSGRGMNSDGSKNELMGLKQQSHKGTHIDLHDRLVVDNAAIGRFWVKPPAGFKQKDLIGIPWRVAFALQEAGWWLRQDIIWSKPNPMPESVTDRCTKSHEYLFLLTKSATYFYNAEAIKERQTCDRLRGPALHADAVSTNGNGGLARRKGDGSRNKRSVWTVTTSPYKDAHFATFPPKLIEPCILAGSREGDLILDPFNGAGTTGLVSLRHRRRYIGIELNPAYIEISERRLKDIQVHLF